MSNLITLTTDFGLTDGFVGAIKGVMLSINPEVRFVDISHEIAPQDIQQGAFICANSVPFFPIAAIHLCIVDPGVGSTRRALAIAVGETIFVGPDNGVLSLAIAETAARRKEQPRAFHLNNPRYWLPRVSNTFHGRDIFAPAAAHLSLGVPLEEIGTPIEEWVTLAFPPPSQRSKGTLVGQVMYIDRYGNLVTNIADTQIVSWNAQQLSVEIGGREIHGLARTYSDVPRGDFAALIGSPWKLEIAQREGNAAATLGVRVGDTVTVRAVGKKE